MKSNLAGKRNEQIIRYLQVISGYNIEIIVNYNHFRLNITLSCMIFLFLLTGTQLKTITWQQTKKNKNQPYEYKN